MGLQITSNYCIKQIAKEQIKTFEPDNDEIDPSTASNLISIVKEEEQSKIIKRSLTNLRQEDWILRSMKYWMISKPKICVKYRILSRVLLRRVYKGKRSNRSNMGKYSNLLR